VMRVRSDWTGGAGTPYVSTMYFAGTGALLAQDAVNAVVAFWNGIGDRIAAVTDVSVSPEVFVVNEVNGETTALHNTTPGTVTTTAAGEVMATAVQGLVRWTTGTYLNGRQIRGRQFLPSPTETDSTTGRPSSTYVTDVNANAATLVGLGILGVWRRPKFNAEGTLTRDGAFILANGSSCWTEWAVLRSRRS
jgi:hypothetical protein